MSEQNQWQTLQNEVADRQKLFDRLTLQLVEDYHHSGKRIHCGRGCRACCNLAVNCTYPEALRVAGALTAWQTATMQDHGEKLLKHMVGLSDLKSYLKMQRTIIGYCPLLSEEGSCGVYDQRPFSCRALLSTMESRWCGADFSLLSSDEKRTFMESLDRRAVAFPMHYLAASRELGEQFEAQSSLAMATTFGFTVSGNLPFLIYLETEYDFANILSRGYYGAVRFLQQAGLFHPFLITMDEI